jgi:hypothetical protein
MSLEIESTLGLVLKAPHLGHTSFAHLGCFQAYNPQSKHLLPPQLEEALVSVFPTMF